MVEEGDLAAGSKDGGGGEGSDPPSRGERLSAALRENLRRRKEQARARRGGAGVASADEAPADESVDAENREADMERKPRSGAFDGKSEN